MPLKSCNDGEHNRRIPIKSFTKLEKIFPVSNHAIKATVVVAWNWKDTELIEERGKNSAAKIHLFLLSIIDNIPGDHKDAKKRFPGMLN